MQTQVTGQPANVPISARERNEMAVAEIMRKRGCSRKDALDHYTATLQRQLKEYEAMGITPLPLSEMSLARPDAVRERAPQHQTAYEEASALAREISEKRRISYHAALQLVWDQHPELYKRHAAERGQSRERQATTRAAIAGGETPVGSAYAQMQDLAREKVAQGKAKTLALAVNEVAKERPDLYRQHLKEVGR